MGRVGISLSSPPTPLRDAVYVGISVLLCFVASAYFIYQQASTKDTAHNRQLLESIAWRTANAIDLVRHGELARTPPNEVSPARHGATRKPLSEEKAASPIVSRIFSVTFDQGKSRMVLDTAGFPPRSQERLPSDPVSGSNEAWTIHLNALSVAQSRKEWVGELTAPGGQQFLAAMVPLPSSPDQPASVLVVEAASDHLHPTMDSLRSASVSSVLVGAIVSSLVSLSVYSFRKKNDLDSELLAAGEMAERALIDAIGEAIYRIEGSDGRMSWRGFLTGLGGTLGGDAPKSRDEWIKRIDPSDLPACRQAWGGPPGGKWNVEYRFLGGDGRVHWLLDRGQHVGTASGKITTVGTILDLTPLREIEHRLRDVVDAAGEFIWETDAAGLFRFLSDRATIILDYPIDRLIGTHPLSLVPPEDVEAVQRRMEETHESQTPFRDFEHRMVRADGKIIWVTINGVPVKNAQGSFSDTAGPVSTSRPAKKPSSNSSAKKRPRWPPTTPKVSSSP